LRQRFPAQLSFVVLASLSCSGPQAVIDAGAPVDMAAPVDVRPVDVATIDIASIPDAAHGTQTCGPPLPDDAAVGSCPPFTVIDASVSCPLFADVDEHCPPGCFVYASFC
jgi:hypothetical protein